MYSLQQSLDRTARFLLSWKQEQAETAGMTNIFISTGPESELTCGKRSWVDFWRCDSHLSPPPVDRQADRERQVEVQQNRSIDTNDVPHISDEVTPTVVTVVLQLGHVETACS